MPDVGNESKKGANACPNCGCGISPGSDPNHESARYACGRHVYYVVYNPPACDLIRSLRRVYDAAVAKPQNHMQWMHELCLATDAHRETYDA